MRSNMEKEKLLDGIKQLWSYVDHYEITCNALEFDKSPLAKHVKAKRDEMIHETRQFLCDLEQFVSSASTHPTGS